jgi:MinD-like ATPase involved in chromosome partitioning or flagellar assembly
MPKTKIIVIHSFRGGTGKSNVTANLAAQVAMKGYRVGIVDTDIQSPGIHVLFGLNADTMGHTINEYLQGKCTIEQVAHPVGEQKYTLPGIKQLEGKHLWLLPASMKTEEINRILHDGYDPSILNKGMKELRTKYNLDYFFIDSHPGINEETLLSIAKSHVLFLILRPDQQDFQGTAVVMDVARSLDIPNLMLIVNKVLNRYDRSQVKAEIEKRFGAPVACVLPLSEDMVDLGSADIFSLCHPDHVWSRAIRDAADALIALE